MNRLSLRMQLLIGILMPVTMLISLNTVSLYYQALDAADAAYDRTLLASAKLIGDFLSVTGSGSEAKLVASVPYSALESFEADARSRMFYKVSGFSSELVSGYDDLRTWQGHLPSRSPYSTLVHFYDDKFRGERVRVAVLLQPVSSPTAIGMATIQVAETLELREDLARRILFSTLWRQLALVGVIAVVVVVVVQRATKPVRQLSHEIGRRTENDLSPIAEQGNTTPELRPLVDATNQVMRRLQHLLNHQKRFVRDTSHQLRTPLAVLKLQVQSALRGDVEPIQALHEISQTVERATVLANQMLAIAKAEQLRLQDPNDAPVLDWSEIVRAVALDLSALIGERHLDFEIVTVPAPVRSHEWSLRELTRNLLHNAIKHTPAEGTLNVRLHSDGRHAALVIRDSGPGISDELRERLFQPFAAGDVRSGTGLGLAICREIVDALSGSITLDNRQVSGRTVGLDATVRLALASTDGAPLDASVKLALIKAEGAQ